MSSGFNYKALWLYYKTKALTIVMLLAVLLAGVLIIATMIGSKRPEKQ
jgi:hypothetical protein